MFEAKEQGKGNLGLEDGFLLSVGGESRGWRVCEGDLGQQVVSVFFFFSIFVSLFVSCELPANALSVGCLEGRGR